MKAIETTALTKRYKDKIAVDALNLTIDQGELFALLGVNGAGKTTTIKMLSCLLRPTSGDALLMGKSIVSQPYEVKKNINVSPQETAIAPNLSVRENLELICGVYGESRSQSKQKAQETITAFGMEEIAKSRAKTLSGGWQRRLSIAMALISEPQILFLDEPTLRALVSARCVGAERAVEAYRGAERQHNHFIDNTLSGGSTSAVRPRWHHGPWQAKSAWNRARTDGPGKCSFF